MFTGLERVSSGGVDWGTIMRLNISADCTVIMTALRNSYCHRRNSDESL